MRSVDNGHESRAIEPRNIRYRWKSSLFRDVGDSTRASSKALDAMVPPGSLESVGF